MIAVKDIPLVITRDAVWKPPVKAGQEFAIVPDAARVLAKRGMADFVQEKRTPMHDEKTFVFKPPL